MRPKTPVSPSQIELLNVHLKVISNSSNPLIKLPNWMDCDGLDHQLAAIYSDQSRPGTYTRLIIIQTLPQRLHGLNEDEVVDRRPENPYRQYLCSETFFQLKRPIVRSVLSKWRKRIKKKDMNTLLQEILSVDFIIAAVNESNPQRICVDTTVQPKAVTHPIDTKLLNRSREYLVKLAEKLRVRLRQSYRCKGLQTVLMPGRYSHAWQMLHMCQEVNILFTYLGRVIRDIERKASEIHEALGNELQMAKRLEMQRQQ